jgi:nitrile hydratase beta subunit
MFYRLLPKLPEDAVMDGIHDMGGMHGFGSLEFEVDEPVFHYEWEGRVFAINWAILAAAGMSLDAGRSGIEQLPPADYLSLPYFGRWFNAMCGSLVGSGLFTEDQMASIRKGQLPDLPVAGPVVEPADSDALLAPQAGLDLAIHGSPPQRAIESEPEFEIGQTVRGRNIHPASHTRLPRYTRGRQGVVVADRGGHVYPDSNALGLGEDPRRLYAVRFSAREQWGDSANSKDSVTLDLWEPYLEPA